MTVTEYMWDPMSDNVLLESDEDGGTRAEYTNEPHQFGSIVSQRADSETNWYHVDSQGSTRQLTDVGEGVIDETTYSAFGNEVSKTGATANPWGYKGALGYYTDGPTGLYVRRRSYDVNASRWLSLDPLGLIDDLNLYTYGFNNPLTWGDPSGLICSPLDGTIVDSGVGGVGANAKCCIKIPFGIETLPPQMKFDKRLRRSRFILPFRVQLQFDRIAKDCECRCCEYRQCIKGTFEVGGMPFVHQVCGVPLKPKDYLEDCKLIGGKKVFAGHREDENRPATDYYFEPPDRKTGCKYQLTDVPGIAVGRADYGKKAVVKLKFKLLVFDTCAEPIRDPCKEHGKVVDKKEIDIGGEITLKDVSGR